MCVNMTVEIGKQESSILKYLTDHEIQFERFEHEPLCTMEQARARPGVHGVMSKNLFLKGRNPDKFFLLVAADNTRADLSRLQTLLGVKKLSFAKEEDLLSMLGVPPGSVTLLAMVNDTAHKVTLVLDSRIWNAEESQHHPLINTSTVVISRSGLKTFLTSTGHIPTVVDLVERTSDATSNSQVVGE